MPENRAGVLPCPVDLLADMRKRAKNKPRENT
jgi:hypothetical protein